MQSTTLHTFTLLAFLSASLAACERGQPEPAAPKPAEAEASPPADAASAPGAEPEVAPKASTDTQPPAAALALTSPAFAADSPIPKVHAYTGEGENRSPALHWTALPPETQSLALVCDDPDAPSPAKPRENPWVHWVVYDLDPTLTDIPEGQALGTQGVNDFGEQGWGGPMPPPGSGRHRYVFRLYALDTRLGLPAGASKAELLAAMEGHVLAQAELVGTYER